MKKRTLLTLLLSLIATVCCVFGLAACNTKDNTVAVTGVTLSSHTLSIAVGETETLSATISPENATDKTVTWSSSNEAVATVSQTGVVTAVTAGTADITVTTKDGNKTDTCAVTVQTVSATSVAIDETTLTLEAGTTGTLSAVFTPANTTNKNVTWSSNNPDVATVSQAGVVTAFEKGTATITVTSEDGNFTATCTVTVVGKKVTGVTLDKATLPLTVGGGSQLTATVAPSDADIKTVSWSSSNEAVATVSEQGIVTAISAGTATITVTTTDGSKTAECAVTVSNPTYSIHVKYADGSAVEAGFKLKINDGTELTTDADGNVSAQLAPATHSVAFTTMPTKGLTATYSLTTTVDDIAEGVDLTLTTDGTGVSRATARTLTAGEFSLRLVPLNTQYYTYTPASNELLTITAGSFLIYDNANYDTSTDMVTAYIKVTNGKAELEGGATYYILFFTDGDNAGTANCNVSIHTHTYATEFTKFDDGYHAHAATCASECGTTTVSGKEAHEEFYVEGECTVCGAIKQAPAATTGINYSRDSEYTDGATINSIGGGSTMYSKKEIVIPEQVSVFEEGEYVELPVVRVTSVINRFVDLQSIYLPSTLKVIENGAFRTTGTDNQAEGCGQLHTVYITDLDAWCQIEFKVQTGDRYGSAPFRHSGSGTIYVNYKPLVNANISVDISAAAFYNVTSLETVTLGNDVTSIGDYAFAGCTNLKSIIIGAGVSVGANTFKGCSSDLKIYYKGTLAQWNAMGVTLPEGATVYVYETNEALNVTGDYWHYEADNTTIKSWHHDYVLPTHTHTPSAEYSYDKSNHWYACTWTDPDNTVEGVCGAHIGENEHNISGGVCSVCDYDINSYTVGLAFEVSGDHAVLTGIGEATLTDGALSIPKTVTIGGNTYDVTEIKASAFASNTTITSVAIHREMTINNSAFKRCTNLTTLKLNAPVTVTATSTSQNPFQSCSSLKNVYVNELSTWTNSNWTPGTTYCGPYVSVSAENKLYVNNALFTTVSGVTQIPAYAYYRVASITSVDLTGVTSIGSNALSGCSGITEVKIDTLANWFTLANTLGAGSPLASAENATLKVGGTAITSFNASANGLTEIPDYAFYGVKSLTSIDLTGVTSIGQYAFANTGISGSFTVGENLTTIGSNAFAGTQISELTVNAAISLNSSQFNCTTLTKVTVNAATTIASNGIGIKVINLYLNAPITTTGSNPFGTNITITGVYVDTVATWLGCTWSNLNNGYVFTTAKAAQCIYVKNNTTGEYDALTRFVASEYSITTLPANAFKNCAFLTYVDLSGVTEIGNSALYGIAVPIIIDGSLKEIGSTAFYGIYDDWGALSPVKLIVKGSANSEGVEVNASALPSTYLGVAANLYYYGTQADYEASGWNNVANLTSGSTTVPTDNIYFYSETDVEGCWHYAADNVTPVLW